MTPTENDTTSPRVYHGGSWSLHVPSWVRAASRRTIVPAFRDNSIGFRCSLAGRVKR